MLNSCKQFLLHFVRVLLALTGLDETLHDLDLDNLQKLIEY